MNRSNGAHSKEPATTTTPQEIITFVSSWRARNAIPDGRALSQEEAIQFARDLNAQLQLLSLAPQPPREAAPARPSAAAERYFSDETQHLKSIPREQSSMGFVNESIEGKGKDKFLSYHFASPITHQPVPPYKWTIDRGRDVFLVSLGGQGGDTSEIPEFFALVWQGHVVRFEAFSRGTGDISVDCEKWWRITQLAIPKVLEPRAEEVLRLLREALDARGVTFRRDTVKAVHVDIVVQPKFV